MVQAFRRKMERTLKISEKESDNFYPVKERDVEEWMGRRQHQLRSKKWSEW